MGEFGCEVGDRGAPKLREAKVGSWWSQGLSLEVQGLSDYFPR